MDDNTRRAIIEAIDTTTSEYFQFDKISKCKFDIVEKFIRNHRLGITISDVLGYRDMAIIGAGKKGHIIAKTFLYYSPDGRKGEKILFEGMVHAGYEGRNLYVEYKNGNKKSFVTKTNEFARYYAVLLEQFAAAMEPVKEKPLPEQTKVIDQLKIIAEQKKREQLKAEIKAKIDAQVKAEMEAEKKAKIVEEKVLPEKNKFPIEKQVTMHELPKMNTSYQKSNSELTKEDLYWIFYEIIGEYLYYNDEGKKYVGLYDFTTTTRFEEGRIGEWELKEAIYCFEDCLGIEEGTFDSSGFTPEMSMGELIEAYASRYLSAERNAQPIRPTDAKESSIMTGRGKTIWRDSGTIEVEGQVVQGKINVGDILGVHLYNDIDLKLKLEQIVAGTNIKTAVNGQFAKYIFKCTDELLAVVRGKHHPAYDKDIWYIDKQ